MRTILSLCAVILCAGLATAAPVKPREVHVSPDGTVNELHNDGIYRAVPGEPKRKAYAAPVPGGSVVPTVGVPVCANGVCSIPARVPAYLPAPSPFAAPVQVGGCPGGVCPAPVQRRGLFRW